jgi:hypothetical protein
MIYETCRVKAKQLQVRGSGFQTAAKIVQHVSIRTTALPLALQPHLWLAPGRNSRAH